MNTENTKTHTALTDDVLAVAKILKDSGAIAKTEEEKHILKAWRAASKAKKLYSLGFLTWLEICGEKNDEK